MKLRLWLWKKLTKKLCDGKLMGYQMWGYIQGCIRVD